MLENCTSREERWEAVQSLIQRWLAERQELVVMYCSLCGMGKLSDDHSKTFKRLEAFCEVLVDYVSAGHFEVYDQLAKEAEAFRDGSIKLFDKLYPGLHETTQSALDFNDSFDAAVQDEQTLVQLKEQLSRLGEQLDRRFELEDRLIEELHIAHKVSIAAHS